MFACLHACLNEVGFGFEFFLLFLLVGMGFSCCYYCFSFEIGSHFEAQGGFEQGGFELSFRSTEIPDMNHRT